MCVYACEYNAFKSQKRALCPLVSSEAAMTGYCGPPKAGAGSELQPSGRMGSRLNR